MTVDRVVIIGASAAGFFAAAAAAGAGQTVTRVERDGLPEQPRPRAGVPPGQHLPGFPPRRWAQGHPRPGAKKDLPDESSSRRPDDTPGVEAYLLRAYPETEIPGDATLAARNAWASLNASTHSTGSWQLIGPSKATYPSVLGLEQSRVEAGRLTRQAHDALRPLGRKADTLHALANYLLEREY